MTPTNSPTLASQATAELPSEERERILKAAALAMPFTNPLIWQDWQEGHTVHTEADDIVAIWQAAEAAGRVSRAQSEWISVETRLPDSSRRVLACNPIGYVGAATYANGHWNGIGGASGWMELPKPNRNHWRDEMSSAFNIPAGWKIDRQPTGELIINGPHVGVVVRADATEPRMIPEEVLFMLASALLAVSPPVDAVPGEPVAPPEWTAHRTVDGLCIVIDSADFEHDASLILTGDFATEGEKLWFAGAIADKLNRPAASDRAGVASLVASEDTRRLYYLQQTGSTVELVPGGHGGLFFRIGGLYRAVHADIRQAIDAARASAGEAQS